MYYVVNYHIYRIKRHLAKKYIYKLNCSVALSIIQNILFDNLHRIKEIKIIKELPQIREYEISCKNCDMKLRMKRTSSYQHNDCHGFKVTGDLFEKECPNNFVIVIRKPEK